MKIKNILWVTIPLLFAALLLSSFSEEKHDGLRMILQKSPENRANAITFLMTDKLTLDERQTEKAYVINLKYAQKVQPFFTEATLLQGSGEAVAKINADRKKELRAILNPDQVKQANELRRQWIGCFEKILEGLKENDLINN